MKRIQIHPGAKRVCSASTSKSRRTPAEIQEEKIPKSILAKFKPTARPKLPAKRPHLTVEYEKGKDEQSSVKQDGDVQGKIVKEAALENKIENTVSTIDLCSSSSEDLLSEDPKFEPTARPKLSGKRPHLTVGYEKSEDEQTSVAQDGDVQDIIVKEEIIENETENNVSIIDLCSSSSECLLSEDPKFKPTARPKLAGRRPHLTVGYDISENEQTSVTQGGDVQENNVSIINLCSTPSEDLLSKELEKFPTHWEEMLVNIREMRKRHNAPVDAMGCNMSYDKSAKPKDARFQILLSLMLSTMTKDHITFRAMQNLIKHGCTVDKMMEISNETLGELIYPVNFWKKKVVFIKDTTKMIKEEYGGDIPMTVKQLVKLKGVGAKMAHLCMQTAWGEITGIGVDTHVHRISNRIGWVEAKYAEGTRRQLEDWLPKGLWKEINPLLVGFGQQICLPLKPQCTGCLVNHICPHGIAQMKK